MKDEPPNRLSLIEDEGFIVLALDGKRIPGQCSISWKEYSSPALESPPMLEVHVIFEVPGKLPNAKDDHD